MNKTPPTACRQARSRSLTQPAVFHFDLAALFHRYIPRFGKKVSYFVSIIRLIFLLAICFIFAWLPVESIIHDHQQEYYDAINASNDAGESTAFIEFMLSPIKEHRSSAPSTRVMQ